jgi:hypothetical protein
MTGGLIFLSVPIGRDLMVFNAHRVYGTLCVCVCVCVCVCMFVCTNTLLCRQATSNDVINVHYVRECCIFVLFYVGPLRLGKLMEGLKLLAVFGAGDREAKSVSSGSIGACMWGWREGESVAM